MEPESIPVDDGASEASSLNTNEESREGVATRNIRIKMHQRDNLLTRLRSVHIGVLEGESLSLRQLAAKLSLVERQYTALDALQTQLEELDESQLEAEHRVALEESYVEAKAAILDQMEELQRIQPSTQLSSTHVERCPTHRINLPKLQLTKFSGKQSEWLDFHNVFTTLVHNNRDLTNIERFQYLRSCLTEEASRLIQSLEVTSNNYSTALDLLITRFNNSRLIFQSHMQQICDLSQLSSSNLSSLRNFIDTVNVNLRAMQSLATTQQVGEAILLHLVSSKLDPSTRTKWEEEVAVKWTATNSTPLQMPTWTDLASFLERRCQTFNMLAANKPTPELASSSKKYASKTLGSRGHSLVTTNSTTKCLLCGTSPHHSPFNCEQFMKLSPQDRFLRVKRLNLCLNCLGKNHTSSVCPSVRRCQHCRVSHHTLLHRTYGAGDSSNNTTNIVNSPAVENTKPVVLQVKESCGDVILATARVYLSNSSGYSTIVRALLDSGSQLNFVTERIAQHLHLPRVKGSIEVIGIGSTSTKMQQTSQLTMKSLHMDYSSSFEAVIIPTITAQHPNVRISSSACKIPNNIKLADESFHEPQGVDCLIGAGLFFDLLLVGQIKDDNRSPILQKTKLGWIVSGPIPSTKSASSQTTISSSSLSSKISSLPAYKTFITVGNNLTLDNLLQKFWTLEGYTEPVKMFSEEEQACERFFEATTRRCPTSNKFFVRLPFKGNPESLGQSYEIAFKRLVALEHKLLRNPSMLTNYRDFIHEYAELGHMTLTDNSTHNRYFIPHHCVIKADSSTTKLRVVFDASCQTSNGRSLNDILRVGPTLQDDIFTILVRFRIHKYVLMADIAKMYRQVLVDNADANWQCILWRNSPLDPVKVYQLKTVTYGTSSAPYLATKCLLELAKRESTEFPIGSAITLKDFYVDNLMTGGPSVDAVVEIKGQVTALLQRGGFPLRKFASNNKEIINDVPFEDREEPIGLGDSTYVKTLGLRWSPSQDAFFFCYTGPSATRKPTKRAILSQIATLFDPLGLLNPLIVSGKILMQQLWKLKLDWDESVPQDVHTQWRNFEDHLSLINNIQLPRYVPMNVTTQIHAFADASTKAYGACIYVVTRQEKETTSSLLCAKSRVAPTKQVSLPRLELCATMSVNIHCWTDSTIALSWIRGEPCRWTVFVANRVSKIQQLTSHYKWHHVPSELNPADIVSRGTTVAGIRGNQLWFQGPPFLKTPQEEWPNSSFDTIPDIPEQRKQRVTLLSAPQVDIFAENKYVNSYNKFLRIFTYVRHFMSRTPVASITPEEINDTLEFVCRRIQKSHFGYEYSKLQFNQPISKTSKLASLSPFLHNNLIRVGGRLKNSTLSFDAKHPIVLPHSHPFVHSLITHYHRKNLHAGAQTLLNIIRDKFWVVGARTTIRQVIHSCIRCYRLRPIVTEQLMGSLPTCRIMPSYPFETTGVDYCGPLLITQRIRGRPPIKVYIAVFICFTTKAVHLEIAPDLSTAAFIATFKRFIARRGKCRVVVSDNATNFVGANRELRELLHSFTTEAHIERVEEFCRNEGIEWKFIPPRSPHFGGLWESAVKLAKYHLRRAIGNNVLTHDELHTIVCQAEAVVNSRPLTPISSDPNDLRPLTPGHFLIGRSLLTVPEPSVPVNLTSTGRSKIIQYVQQQFWHRWQQDYLKELQRRSKWKTASPNINVNDLVILKDDLTPPLKWPMGRIIATLPGDDGR
ncbi:uncharacterized protein LOC118756302, partial [Rhagoletis pomonella]|uniref:uncharacterized protein LOC118756302 n=1 Tax=Rhagoletis pomonella TaxID=28610 RepID=UPI001785C16D